MRRILQNRPSPNPLKLSRLFSASCLTKKGCFSPKDGSARFSLSKPGRGAVARPNKPAGVKHRGMIKIAGKQCPPNPLRLSCLFSATLLAKRACFSQKDGSARFSLWKLRRERPAEARKPILVKGFKIRRIGQYRRSPYCGYPTCLQQLTLQKGRVLRNKRIAQRPSPLQKAAAGAAGCPKPASQTGLSVIGSQPVRRISGHEIGPRPS